MNRNNLLAFLRGQLSETDETHGDCRMFVLYLAGKSRKEDDTIRDWPVRKPGSSRLLVDMKVLADQIGQECDQQAAAIGGIVKFRLAAMRGESMRPTATHFIRIYAAESEETDNDGPVQLEEATPKGTQLQYMRHIERYHQQHMNGMAEVMRLLRNDNERQSGLIEIFMARFVDLIKATESAMSEGVRRQLMQSDIARREKITETFVGKIEMFIPLLVSKVMGMPAGAMGGPNPEREMLNAFFRSITKPQLDGFLAGLDEAQRTVVIAFYQQLLDEEEQKQASAAASLRGAAPSPKQLEEKKDAAE